MLREDKRGYLSGEPPRILERLHIDPEQFIATTARMLQQFSTAIGTPEHLTAHCVTRNIAFLRDMSAARRSSNTGQPDTLYALPENPAGHPQLKGGVANNACAIILNDFDP